MDIIEQVREGMDVVDANGEKIGTVRYVRMGDPDAATDEGQSVPREPMADFLVRIFGSTPDLSDEQAARLARVGFVQVDRALFESDVFVASDQLARVDDDVLHLSIAVD
ncbi:hypothetical protein [Microcella sp.]|uniref:hypothetical protein n=1 Tax=Microcella sp. TaxID=1913979 RepID=UPI00256CD42B|nr:hypothetical protein [Microcella sp.]MBX9473080.1 hypothetical protein [Microcella sp.]